MGSRKDSLANQRLSPDQARERKAGWKHSTNEPIFNDDQVVDMSRRMDSYTDDEIAAAAERARLRREAEEAQVHTEGPPALKLPRIKPDKPKEKKKGPGRGQPPKYDRQEMKRLYEDEGLTATLIAKKLGTTPNTVIYGLKKLGVEYDPKRNAHHNRKGGKPPRDVCPRGHGMATNSRPVWRTNSEGVKVQNGRECIPCKIRQQREKRNNGK